MLELCPTSREVLNSNFERKTASNQTLVMRTQLNGVSRSCNDSSEQHLSLGRQNEKIATSTFVL